MHRPWHANGSNTTAITNYVSNNCLARKMPHNQLLPQPCTLVSGKSLVTKNIGKHWYMQGERHAWTCGSRYKITTTQRFQLFWEGLIKCFRTMQTR